MRPVRSLNRPDARDVQLSFNLTSDISDHCNSFTEDGAGLALSFFLLLCPRQNGMLLSTKDQGLGRRRRSYSHSHVYSMNKAARSSKLSLLSAITTQSTGSNGSNSTVTQESYNKSRSETSRKRKSSKRRKEAPQSKTPPMEAVEEAISEGEGEQEEVDVFAFLVGDASSEPEDEQDNIAAKAAADIANQKDGSGQSLHSDSGISMDDGNIVLGQTTLKPPLSTLPEYRPLEPGEMPQVRSDWTWPDVPKPKHTSFNPAEQPHHWAGIEYATKGVDSVNFSPQGYCFTPDSPVSRSQSLLPYDRIVATSPGSPGPPLRVFTQTCQRLLLELQQAVSELDSELKHLEAYVNTTSPVGTGPTTSSDRRGSWNWGQHPSELHVMRSDIIGRLHMKLENYYQLLLLSQKVVKLKATSSASPEHVERFRARLSEIGELVPSSKKALLAALSEEDDLISLGSNRGETPRTIFYDNLGRTVLGVVVLIAAGMLQVVSGLSVKLLIGVQMVGMVVALCLPLRI